ncbi:MAG: M56 family metallopeptidase [Planctomycetaceae bacterium]
MNAQFFGSSQLVDVAWRLNIQAGLLVLIVGLLCLIGKRWISPGWRSLLWMVVFARLILLVGPSSTFSLANLTTSLPATSPASHERTTDSLATDDSPQVSPDVAEPLPIPEHVTEMTVAVRPVVSPIRPTDVATGVSNWSMRDVAVAVWMVVAVFLLARLLVLKRQLTRELEAMKVIRQQRVLDLASSAAQEAGLRHVPHLLWGPAACSPAVCGWWKPVLILPGDASELSDHKLRIVLLHEFRHVRSGDTLLTWIPRVACAVFWFNPMLWLASWSWHEERELACDEWVVSRIGRDQKRSYLETLVEIATRSPQVRTFVFTASIVSPSSLLERRIVAMKRYRPPTWTGLIAGSLLLLLLGAIGLTDAVLAENPAEEGVNAELAQVESLETASPTLVALNVQEKPQPPNQAKTLKPKVVFARHVILWNGEEVLTREQLKERLATLRETQPVKPFVYHSLGFTFQKIEGTEGEEAANAKANDAVMDSLKLIGMNEWSMLSFLSRRGSAVVDRIKSAEDFNQNSGSASKGRVVFAVNFSEATGSGPVGTDIITHSAAKGAQVVILPLGEPADVHIRKGKLRDPDDEIWFEADEDGFFTADAASVPFDPVLLYGEGKYLTLMLHESGYRIVNGQLAASDATYVLRPWIEMTVDTSNLKPNEEVELWVTPSDVHEKFPGLAVGTLKHSDEPITIKVPAGKGRFAYFTSGDEGWNDTKFRHPATFSTDGEKVITLPTSP